MKTARRIAAAAFLALGASLGLSAPTASAGISNSTVAADMSTSKKHLANFEGTASYDADAGKLTITLKNSSNRGFLTGFAFNAKGAAKAKYIDGDVLGTRHDEDAFDKLGVAKKTGVAKIKPFGMFEAGAGLDGKFNGGKGIKRGVGAGMTRTFMFDVIGGGDMTVTDLLGDGATLLANFRGFKKGKKDQVAARLTLLAENTTLDNNTTSPGGNTTLPGTNLNESPSNTGNPGGNNNPGSNDPHLEVPPSQGGDNGGAHAVPLPAAAWTGLGTMGLMGIAGLRRMFGRREIA